jgi:hypothetical protein
LLGEEQRSGLPGESVGGPPGGGVTRGVGMSRGMADLMGLSAQVTAVPADAYEGPRTHAPGNVFAGVADGEDRLTTCP